MQSIADRLRIHTHDWMDVSNGDVHVAVAIGLGKSKFAWNDELGQLHPVPDVDDSD